MSTEGLRGRSDQPLSQHLSPSLPLASGCLFPAVSPALALGLLELCSGKYLLSGVTKHKIPTLQ